MHNSEDAMNKSFAWQSGDKNGRTCLMELQKLAATTDDFVIKIMKANRATIMKKSNDKKDIGLQNKMYPPEKQQNYEN